MKTPSNRTPDPDAVPRCDYEGSDYQSRFWTSGRRYEDLAERIALRAMLPATGRRLIEIGAGAGRLAEIYSGFEEIYLLDYAYSQLEHAQRRWGDDPRFTFVQGDIYRLPFPTGYFDTVVSIRVLHHVRALEQALAEVARVTAPGGVYVTEAANKRNLKAILRWLAGRAKEGEAPFSETPYEFVPLNIDHHPAHLTRALEGAGFTIEARRAVSQFRLPLLKRTVPAPLLAALDGRLQRVAAPLALAPSLFYRGRRQAGALPTGTRWRCPQCGALDLRVAEEGLRCAGCGRHYPTEHGIHRLRPDIS